MDRVDPRHPKEAAKAPNRIQPDHFSLDRLLSHIDLGPCEESEAFVHQVYKQRQSEKTADLGALRIAGEKMQVLIAAAGTSEDELVADFEKLRRKL